MTNEGTAPDADRPQPRGKRQRLAAELRRLRDLAGLSGRELAARLGVSQSKISRIESTALLPSLPEVEAWAEAVGAPLEVREALRELTSEAFIEVHTWRTRAQALPDVQEELRRRDIDAQTLLNLQLTVIPGLLQTAAYARQMFTTFVISYTPEEVASWIAARIDRQVILYGEQHLEFLIGEAALRTRYGPVRDHLAQLDRIASLTTLTNVRIGLLPHHHQAHTQALHGFTLYQGAQPQDTLVAVEALHGQLYVTDPDSIDLYRRQWDLLRASALFDAQARAFLQQLIAEIGEQEP
ncbi:helix-turn-helix domain-containing protein [Nonomuraea sp. NPDC004702]